MTNEMIEKIGERMVALINVRNLYHGNEPTKFDHELNGMYQLLKATELPIKFKYSETAQDYTQIESVIICDREFACRVRFD